MTAPMRSHWTGAAMARRLEHLQAAHGFLPMSAIRAAAWFGVLFLIT